jgi:hypothetical protein
MTALQQQRQAQESAYAIGLALGRLGKDRAGISGENPACGPHFRFFWLGVEHGLVEHRQGEQLVMFG